MSLIPWQLPVPIGSSNVLLGRAHIGMVGGGGSGVKRRIRGIALLSTIADLKTIASSENGYGFIQSSCLGVWRQALEDGYSLILFARNSLVSWEFLLRDCSYAASWILPCCDQLKSRLFCVIVGRPEGLSLSKPYKNPDFPSWKLLLFLLSCQHEPCGDDLCPVNTTLKSHGQ